MSAAGSSSGAASLDENIWEFEWKRLDKHSMKILAPIILLGMRVLVLTIVNTRSRSKPREGGREGGGCCGRVGSIGDAACHSHH